jgi:hypothetical protein
MRRGLVIAAFVLLALPFQAAWAGVAAASVSTTVAVPAAAGGGIVAASLPANATVTVTASGTWCMGGTGATAECGSAAGIRLPHADESGMILPAAKIGMLLGRIGGGQPFAIGSRSSFSSRSGGPLTLLFNDRSCCYGDNSGQLQVRVTVSSPVPITGTSYNVGVLVLDYFPLTSNGQNIDIGVTGDVGGTYASVKANVTAMTTALPELLSAGSSYRAYANPLSKPSLTYSIMSTREIDAPVPKVASNLNAAYPYRADYASIFSGLDICSLVAQGLKEVWIWAYQGPHQLDISESKMSGPFGDISNSYGLNDLPQCGRTYTVYTFNYGRDVALAVHSYGHQLEAELSYVNSHLFRDLFEGPNYPATLGVTGRCGSVHNPPNARFEYDWANSTLNASDCDAWNPNGLGTVKSVSCTTWTCIDTGNDDPQLRYLVWWMQHFPGRGNKVTYQGLQMRNWWDVHGDFDAVAGGNRSLALPGI